MDALNDFQKELSRAINLAGGSQEQLGKAIGLGQGAVSKWKVNGFVPLKSARKLVKKFPELSLKVLADIPD